MRKKVHLFISVAIVFVMILSYTVSANADEKIHIFLNGKTIDSTIGVQNMNGNIMVPFKVIGNELGAEIKWEQVTKTITMTRGNDTVIMCFRIKKG